MQKNEIAKSGCRKTEPQPDKVCVSAANGGQKENAYKQCRRADEIEEKGLFFKAHGIEHGIGNHGQAHGDKNETAVFYHPACGGVGKSQRAEVFAQREEKWQEGAGD